MPFDSTCKFLAERFTADLATWLLGAPVEAAVVEPSELSVEPIRADTVVLLESQSSVLHVEFQTDPKQGIPFRVLDYFVRLRRRSPNKTIRQVVVYLRPNDSPLVSETRFEEGKTRHEFEVIRLWECPVEQFLQLPGLLPFAVLNQTEQPEATLREVADRIEAMEPSEERSDLAAVSAVLAGLLLEKAVVKRVLREDVMRESVIYQDILAEGEERGLKRGIEQGIGQGEQALVLRQLDRKVGPIAPELRSRVESLSLPKLEALGEELLDFSAVSELRDWLQVNG